MQKYLVSAVCVFVCKIHLTHKLEEKREDRKESEKKAVFVQKQRKEKLLQNTKYYIAYITVNIQNKTEVNVKG